MSTDQDQKHLHLLEGFEFQPIFIIGSARSGTSILHHTLAATGCFNFVSAYHVSKYNELLDNFINGTEAEAIQSLQQRIEEVGSEDRVFDVIPVAANLPEEYGFILGSRFGGKRFVTSKSLDFFKGMAQKIQYISSRDKPLLLKNPQDVGNFMYLKKSLPNAKFIFLSRYPIHTLNSVLSLLTKIFTDINPFWYRSISQYRNLMDSHSPLSRLTRHVLATPFLDIRLFATLALGLSAQNYFLRNIEKLDPSDYCTVKYEDFCQDPNTTIATILEFLGLTLPEPIDFSEKIQPRPTKLVPDVKKYHDLLLKIYKPLIEYAGYNPSDFPVH